MSNEITLPHLKKVYDQSRAARTAAESLHPLLQLLDPKEGGASPIEDLQDILETLLLGQRLLSQSVKEMNDKLDLLIESRRRG